MTAKRWFWSLLLATALPLAAAATTAPPIPTATPMLGEGLYCPGDCNGDFKVEIAELVRGVAIALGSTEGEDCPVYDGASVSELVTAVRSALDGCTATAQPIVEAPDCRDCCDDCRDSQCVSECVGRDRCTLNAEYAGVVRDAFDDAPIAGARVTLNGQTVTTAEDGSYRVRSSRSEICTGLDYLYEFSVEAQGYAGFMEQLYRVPFPVETGRDVALEPIQNPAALSGRSFGERPPMSVGELF